MVTREAGPGRWLTQTRQWWQWCQQCQRQRSRGPALLSQPGFSQLLRTKVSESPAHTHGTGHRPVQCVLKLLAPAQPQTQSSAGGCQLLGSPRAPWLPSQEMHPHASPNSSPLHPPCWSCANTPKDNSGNHIHTPARNLNPTHSLSWSTTFIPVFSFLTIRQLIPVQACPGPASDRNTKGPLNCRMSPLLTWSSLTHSHFKSSCHHLAPLLPRGLLPGPSHC